MLRPGPARTLEAKAVRRRLEASKTACFLGVAKPADCIGAMYEAASAHRTGAIAVYVERVAGARRIAAQLARAHGAERVAVLTGTLRGQERSAVVGRAVWRRFLPDRERTRALASVYLVMTSAGEVGVDIDADHAVTDLVMLDSMIQRLGRVNRAGLGRATATVLPPPPTAPHALAATGSRPGQGLLSSGSSYSALSTEPIKETRYACKMLTSLTASRTSGSSAIESPNTVKSTARSFVSASSTSES